MHLCKIIIILLKGHIGNLLKTIIFKENFDLSKIPQTYKTDIIIKKQQKLFLTNTF